MSYRLSISKEYLKFSASHFTIFNATEAEALHGHNYRVNADFNFESINEESQIAINFQNLKERLKNICENLDEKILIPSESKHLMISDSPKYKNHIEIKYSDRHYMFPKNETLMLPLTNITSEALAKYIHILIKKLTPEAESISITIKETPGQSATYSA